jgi:hypothetical protein
VVNLRSTQSVNLNHRPAHFRLRRLMDGILNMGLAS